MRIGRAIHAARTHVNPWAERTECKKTGAGYMKKSDDYAKENASWEEKGGKANAGLAIGTSHQKQLSSTANLSGFALWSCTRSRYVHVPLFLERRKEVHGLHGPPPMKAFPAATPC